MNIPLLLKVKEAILAEPKRFEMNYWIWIADDVAPCGTTACIAGFTTAITELETIHPSQEAWRDKGAQLYHNQGAICNGGQSIAAKAMQALELTGSEASRLFYTSSWPYFLARRYFELRDDREQAAQVVAERIDYFIKTNGTDQE